MSMLHPDMVWPWPRTSHYHDPMDWVMEIGRYDHAYGSASILAADNTKASGCHGTKRVRS
ncbi:MAG: hypothetical protein HY808_00455 [Nitrospirae bacterium]|nr:hypothetical protein [Nitrospirota bacterium]